MGHVWDSGSGIFSCHEASPPQRIIWEIFSFLLPSLTEPLWKTWLGHKIPAPKEILVGGAGSGSMGNAERWEEPETRRDSICHRSSHTEASKGYKVLPPGDSPCLSLQEHPRILSKVLGHLCNTRLWGRGYFWAEDSRGEEQEGAQEGARHRAGKQLGWKITPCLAIKRRFPLQTHRTLG